MISDLPVYTAEKIGKDKCLFIPISMPSLQQGSGDTPFTTSPVLVCL